MKTANQLTFTTMVQPFRRHICEGGDALNCCGGLTHPPVSLLHPGSADISKRVVRGTVNVLSHQTPNITLRSHTSADHSKILDHSSPIKKTNKPHTIHVTAINKQIPYLITVTVKTLPATPSLALLWLSLRSPVLQVTNHLPSNSFGLSPTRTESRNL